MKTMTQEQRQHYVQEQSAKRTEVQAKIQSLTAERAIYVSTERKRLAEDGDATLGDVIVRSVREQLDDAGFDVQTNDTAE